MLSSALLSACGEKEAGACDGVAPASADDCALDDLPLSAGGAAPVLTEVALECQDGAVVVHATVEDPQGSANLSNVVQTLAVFRGGGCNSAADAITDDVAESGTEETFGTVYERNNVTEGVIARICCASAWPVQVTLRDADSNETTGVVMAEVR